MVDQAFVPDFSEFFRKDELSDVNLIVEEDRAASCSGSVAGEKRKAPEPDEEEGSLQQTTLPGHSMVLVAFSAFFKAKLKSWSEGLSQSQRSGCQFLQLELGELLLQAMYQSQPDLGAISQVQLLQLLILADRYGVNKVPVAAVAALQAVPQAELQWETVLAVFTLPPGCTDACKPLLPAAQQQLQQQLGDLELALADSQKRQRLLALPHKVLLALLQDEETKVASENTVFRIIQSWHGYQQQHCGGSSDAELLLLLLQQIRMPHCTQPFVATVLAASPLAAKCFSPLELRLACICSSGPGSEPETVVKAMQTANCPALDRFPAWKQPKRPASALTNLSMERELSLEDLKQTLEALQGEKTTYTLFESRRWQGEAFGATLYVFNASKPGDGASEGSKGAAAAEATTSTPFKVGMYVGPSSRRKNMLRAISFSITASAVQPPPPVVDPYRYGRSVVQQPQHIVKPMIRQGFSLEMWGWPDFFGFGAVDIWAAFEAKLRASNLVHAGDCLHIKVEITEVL
ncbi:hypothetical protein OEZ85_013005 [Tetradesmus obliquus]|uniref:BTB domain-containing protein n=1 Tax=Tetradesmus obliquus TaxID=3088 RepID=A0ABY8U4K2_TETOB|nr:hypothetical protein OEZ85_013005 [Tetradesmus obliquus]